MKHSCCSLAPFWEVDIIEVLLGCSEKLERISRHGHAESLNLIKGHCITLLLLLTRTRDSVLLGTRIFLPYLG